MSEVSEVWPWGMPEIVVQGGDGTIVLEGEALCYTMALPRAD